MQYVIRPEIAVEADSPEEAVAKWKTEGKVVNLRVDPRPQSIVTPGRVPGSVDMRAAVKQGT